jgi:alpha-ketoglutarate-dependent taurine dioxygenase
VQLLHCLVNAAEGGRTCFTDGWAVARKLRSVNPTAFELLSRHRHPFEYRDPTQGVFLRAEVPVLHLGPSGDVERVAFNNRSARVPPNFSSNPSIAALPVESKEWRALKQLYLNELPLLTALPGAAALSWQNLTILHINNTSLAGSPSPASRLSLKSDNGCAQQ